MYENHDHSSTKEAAHPTGMQLRQSAGAGMQPEQQASSPFAEQIMMISYRTHTSYDIIHTYDIYMHRGRTEN